MWSTYLSDVIEPSEDIESHKLCESIFQCKSVFFQKFDKAPSTE